MSEDVKAPVDQLAQDKLDRAIRWAVRRELQKLPSVLDEHEDVVNLAQGNYGDKNGLVVVTARRVVFLEEGLAFRSRLEDFPYGRISSVQTEQSMLSGKLTIFASGNKAVIKNVYPKARAVEIGDYVRSRLAGEADAARPAPSPVPPSPDVYEQLRKLGELRDAGVLTASEFEEKKAVLLARLSRARAPTLARAHNGGHGRALDQGAAGATAPVHSHLLAELSRTLAQWMSKPSCRRLRPQSSCVSRTAGR